ncbi:type I methionyl aminopeptidase [Comamonas sp. B-9]|uniref:type I methionyl aminopeptidase n=1 Tax=Comamonas sp. B-9 TaxID=1055192 RepID=UPI0003958265|nr:type I methionyl aminopeptidase [Comamonas sp. B-9]
MTQNITPVHTASELALARQAARLAAEVLEMIAPHVVPGVSTAALDAIFHDYIVNVQKAVPTNLGYQDYPKTILTSVNHVVCHGIPSEDRILKKGDIVNIDVAVIQDGWFGDTSRMYFVGTPSILAKRLVETTYEAMRAGIAQVRPGATLGDIGHAIETVAKAAGFGVVREFCGHGIGQTYHDAPNVLHYGNPGEGLVLEAGMLFTIEPMLNAGKRQVKTLADGWTVVTQDHSLSAQWEHMVAVTPDGHEVLTTWPHGTGSYAPV